MELTLLSRVAYRGQEITGPRLRGLLALLAADLRTGCGAARLIEGLWPDEQPEKPAKALQALVSRARSQLGADLIASTATGYRLTLGEEQVDAAAALLRAGSAGRHARAGDHAAALAEAEQGLAVWESAPEGDVLPDDPVSALRAERRATYWSLARLRALSLARLGRYPEATAPLTELAAQRPHDEEVLAELLRCEAATAGPAAALSRYEAYRRGLRDELGTDPGPALQAIHKQLLTDTAPSVRRGIPYEPNPLLGRDQDLAAVADLLHSSRVVSIVGPGGLGKTRLAYAVARQAEQRVMHMVALAGVTVDDDVAAEVAASLEVAGHAPMGRGMPPSDQLTGIAGALGPGPALLVLDNCEHVIRGAAELVRSLVALTSDVRVLTTSRAPLGLSSESVYPLPELPLPITIELFEQRARAARPGVELPAEPVAELCRRLDGLPLAVELAAARVRAMSVDELADRLADRFSLLRGGARDVPERHQTLLAVVDWSWNLLDPAGQAAMRALSVFPGGFTADAAVHLLGAGDEVLPVLEHLIDQSLLKVADTPAGTRYRMLETVREFSAAQRDAAGETEQVLGGLLGWAREFGMAHHEALLGAGRREVIERIQAEQDNLTSALRYGLAREDGATVAATTAVLAGLWMFEARYPRIVTLVEETGWLLSHFRPEPELVEVTRTAVTLCTVNAVMLLGPRASRSLVALRRLPSADPGTITGAVATVLAAVPEIRGPDSPVLRRLCESDQPLLAAIANGVASYVWEQAYELERALAAAHRMVEATADRAARWVQVLAHSRVSELSLRLERPEPARDHLSAALQLMEAHGPWLDVLQLRWTMVLVHLQLGAIEEAERWLELAGEHWLDDAYGMRAFDLGVRAEIRLVRGEVDSGLREWRHAAEAQRAVDEPLFRVEPLGVDPWALEVQAACVIAHAQHGRLELVEPLVAELPDTLSAMLANPMEKAPTYVMEFGLIGTLLLAKAMVELDRGTVESGVRLVALAERFGYLRSFQPTMSSARARVAAERADRAAYADARSVYAALRDQELRAAALAALPA